MIINVDQYCSIFFGDAKSCPTTSKDPANFTTIYSIIAQKLNLPHIFFTKQTHSTDGTIVNKDNCTTQNKINMPFFGDYLITSMHNRGIGILTADCLPIILYAPDKMIVSSIHAGWRGSLANIVFNTITTMHKTYTIDLARLRVYFGPAAKICCYEMGNDWIENNNIYAQQFCNNSLQQRSNKYYFDTGVFNKNLLIELGVKPDNIDDQYNVCTICNTQFHSYRRSLDKINYMTQASIVWLKQPII